MRPRRSKVRHRLLAALLLAGMALPVLGALAAAPEAPGAAERCLACPDCADDGCGDAAAAAPHDHCCPSSCQGHMGWLLAAPVALAAPARSEGAPAARRAPAPRLSPGGVFHPPRP